MLEARTDGERAFSTPAMTAGALPRSLSSARAEATTASRG